MRVREIFREILSLSSLRYATEEKEKKKGTKRGIERQTRSRRHCVNNGKRHARTHARTHARMKAGKRRMGKGLVAENRLLGLGQRERGCQREKGEARSRQRGLPVLTRELPPNLIATRPLSGRIKFYPSQSVMGRDSEKFFYPVERNSSRHHQLFPCSLNYISWKKISKSAKSP